MSSPRFDAILIDFYGTISCGDREVVEAACSRIVDAFNLPQKPEEFAIRWGRRFFEIVARSNQDAFRTLYECEKLSLQTTLGEFGVEADPAPFVAPLEEYWRDPPAYSDAANFLSGLDLPVCCVSNADTKPLMAAITRLNLRFDAVITSEAARSYKPHPHIFRRALDTLGVSAVRTLHVGDSLHSDIGGAGELGITTVWLQRNSRIHDIGDSKADHIISSLADLSGVIGRE